MATLTVERQPQKIFQDKPLTDSDWLTGSVSKIVFTNNENFTVFEFDSLDGNSFNATVRGVVSQGQALKIQGKFVRHDRFGNQFSVNDFRPIEPRSKEALAAFFASGLAKNVGKKFAANVVSHFGESLPDILSMERSLAIKELSSVDGIGKKRATEIFRIWQEEADFRDLMDFVIKSGLKASDATRIKRAGLTIKDIRKNPYKLMEVLPWAGFKRIDSLALEAGIPADSPARLRAGARFLLEDAGKKNGHTAMSEELFLKELSELMSVKIGTIESTGIVRTKIKDLIALPEVFGAEEFIAKNITRRIEKRPFNNSIVESVKQIKTGGKQIQLTPEQFSAVKMALENKFYVLTGGPGTGKTTIVRAYLTAARTSGVESERIVLCAPTGRAARRLEEATGCTAMTIHRAIGLGVEEEPEGEPQPPKPIERAEIVVVDESSMIDINLMKKLLEKIPYYAKVLMVGDPYQLPSIGQGRVLGDILSSQAIPASKLTFVHRQEQESSIPAVADSIKKGIVPQIPVSGDVSMLTTRTGEETTNCVMSLFKDELSKGTSLADVQVITAMHKGPAGTIILNQNLQKLVISQEHSKAFVSNPFFKFHVGDKIMQTRNDYAKGVMNGEVGSVVFVDNKNNTLIANFENTQANYDKAELDDLQLAYAISAHKSQGGEYKKVFMVVDMSQQFMLERHLLYTGVTRGKEKVILVGGKQSLAIAVKTVKSINRVTTLNDLIKDLSYGKNHTCPEKPDSFSLVL